MRFSNSSICFFIFSSCSSESVWLFVCVAYSSSSSLILASIRDRFSEANVFFWVQEAISSFNSESSDWSFSNACWFCSRFCVADSTSFFACSFCSSLDPSFSSICASVSASSCFWFSSSFLSFMMELYSVSCFSLMETACSYLIFAVFSCSSSSFLLTEMSAAFFSAFATSSCSFSILSRDFAIVCFSLSMASSSFSISRRRPSSLLLFL